MTAARKKAGMVKLDQRLPREPPTEFCIFPAGEWETSKGTYLFDEKSADSVLAAWKERGLKLTFDYEHAALQEAGAIASGAPNAGNFDLELRDGELWAINIRWTERADGYLRSGEYLYFSPAFAHDADGRVTRLVNIALTNLPATFGQEPLVAASDKEATMDPETLKKLTESMGNLAECLTKHGEALAKHGDLLTKSSAGAADDAGEKKDEAKKDEDKDEPKAEAKQLREKLAALTGKSDVSEALGVLTAQRDAAAKLSQVETELATLKAKSLEAEVVALVDGAVKEGKITPAQKASFIEQGKKDLAFLKGFVSSAPKHAAGKEQAKEGGNAGGGTGGREPTDAELVASLNDVDRAAAKNMRVPFLEYAKTKARRTQEGSVRFTPAE